MALGVNDIEIRKLGFVRNVNISALFFYGKRHIARNKYRFKTEQEERRGCYQIYFYFFMIDQDLSW